MRAVQVPAVRGPGRTQTVLGTVLVPCCLLNRAQTLFGSVVVAGAKAAAGTAPAG